MADYTFNYSLLFINHRLINLSVDCPWDLSPQGWFPVPTPGSCRRAVLFLPSYQRPRTSLSGGSTSLLLLVTCKDSTWDWGVWPQCPQSHLPPRLSRPGAAQGLSSLVLHTVTLLPHVALSFLFHKLLPTQKIGRQLEIGGLGVFPWWRRIARKWKEGSWGWGERVGVGVRAACTPCLSVLLLHPVVTGVYIQQLGFF